MASSQSFSMIQRRMLLSPCPASPVKRELPLCTSAMRLPMGVPRFILLTILARNIIWPSSGAGNEGVFGAAAVLHEEAPVGEFLLAAHARQVALPALAVGRIGEHEIELLVREVVVGQRGAVPQVVGIGALAFQDEVGLADGVGLGVDLLAEQVGP